MTEVFLIIFAVIVLIVVLVGAVFVIFRKNPSLVGESYRALVSDLNESNQFNNDQIKKLRDEIFDLQSQLNREKATILELQARIQLFENRENNLPYPQWLKDTSLKMLTLNKAYEDVFLKPIGKKISDYVGKTDYEIWPKEVADKFTENDLRALEKGGKWSGIEPIWLKDNNVSKFWRIYKHVERIGDTIVGVAGFAVPVFPEEGSIVQEVQFVKYLVKEGRIRPALEALEKLDIEEIQKISISLQGRLSRAEQGKHSNTSEKGDYEKELNRIAESILQAIG